MAENPRDCGYTEIPHVDYPSVAESDVKNKSTNVPGGTTDVDEYPCDPNFAADSTGKVTTAAEDKDEDD